MSTPAAGISEADWQATPGGIRALILSQQQEIRVLRQVNEKLRTQLTALATVLASLRERIGRSSRNSSKPPRSDGPGHHCAEALRATSHLSDAKVMAASGALSRAIQDLGRSCCRSSGWMRWSSTTRKPAAVAGSCCRAMIQSRCGIR